ncbi:MAG: transposase family protein [Caldilineaceae bacterium]
MVIKIRDERQMKALTGLSFAEFDRLLPVFTAVYEARQQRRYEQAVQAGSRRRQPGGGRKSKLPTMDDKLFFVLYYFKTYPTFDQLGAKFDLAGGPGIV